MLLSEIIFSVTMFLVSSPYMILGYFMVLDNKKHKG